MTNRKAFLAILLIYLLLAVGYSLSIPLGEAPDEADHYAYIVYLGQNRRLPEGPTVTQGKHPPLYHAAAAALTAWTGLDFSFLRSNPDALPLGPGKPPNFFVHTALEDFPWRGGALAMRLARFLSILLGAVTVWSAWRLGSEVAPHRPAIGLMAAGFLAGLPGFLFISGAVNNDNAAGALGSLALVLCAMTLARGLAWQRSALLGLCLGLGLLSKVGVVALWPLAALAVGGAWWLEPRPRRSWASAVGHLTLAWGIALAVAAPWLLRNWRLYGDPLGWALVRATVDLRQEPLALADIGWLLRGFHTSFWGRFAAAGQVVSPPWVFAAAALFTAALILGGAWYVASGRAALAERRATFYLQLVLLAAAPLLAFLSVVRYSAIALGTDQVRLMFPAAAALAVWFAFGAVGTSDWLRLRRRGEGWPTGDDSRMAAGWIGGIALFGSVTLLAVVRPGFAPPQPVAVQLQAETVLARFGDLELLAADLPVEPVAVGRPVATQLLWRGAAPPADDLRPALRLVHQDGWLAAEWNHSPAGGRHSTDHWRAGEVYADDYLVMPSPAAPGHYAVAVAVRPFGGAWIEPVTALPRLPADPASSEASFVVVGTVELR